MALLLRTVRQNRWHKDAASSWLGRGDVPADPLGDLATSQNRLSVWAVAPDQSNLERIVRAVAIGKDRIADTGYVIFDSKILSVADIEQKSEKGSTPDHGANDWHLDLVDLSGRKLVALAREILQTGESGIILKKRLRELVIDGIENRELPFELRKKVDQ